MSVITTLELKERLAELQGETVTLHGWIRNHRKQKNMGFIDFFDGMCFKNPQVVYDNNIEGFEDIQALRVGSAITVTGKVVPSYKDPTTPEVQATAITLEGDCPEDYPLQPKRHSIEFLREIAYLRPRTRLFQAVFRVRSVASMAIHTYFQDRGYVYVHTPLITGNDAEGAGNTFTVTTLAPKDAGKWDQDFFGKQASLAVTGQLEGETFAMAFSKIYTFGPTFRAENSNTKTHAAEFWMIEPEIAFCDLDQLMDVEEDFLKYLVKSVLEKCPDELAFLDTYAAGGKGKSGLVEKLEALADARCAASPTTRPSPSSRLRTATGSSRRSMARIPPRSMKSTSPRNTSMARSLSTTGPATSRLSTCTRTTTRRPSPPSTCWCPAPAS